MTTRAEFGRARPRFHGRKKDDILSGMTVEVLEKTDVYVVAAWRRIALLVWRGQPSAFGIERSHALFRAWAPAQPGGAALLVVVSSGRVRPPDDEMRAAMARVVEDPPPALKGRATLLEAEGFLAAGMRAIVVRVAQRSGARAPKMLRDTVEAARWAAELLGDPEITSTALAAAIRAAREG